MKKLYLGLLFFTSFIHVLPSKAKRFSGNDQRGSNAWNWNRNDQMASAQTKSSQPTWPSKGNGGTTKGRGDSNPNRDGSWPSNGWSSGDNQKDGYGMGWNTQQPQGNNKGSAYPDGGGEEGGNLETLLRGIPGMDFPDLVVVPDTDFDCSQMPAQGYYGDVETGCQVFHICQPGNRKDSFLCPVGTIFNQKYFVCDWWFNVNCSDTPSYYNLNNDIYKDPAPSVTEVPVTTEKTLPWNAQDLDKKRPTKSWGSQPSLGKQNPSRKDTPNRRGSKANPVATSREVSNAWSRSDVQKEITLSWGASSGSYGSSSTSSNSIIPTTKPIWYGIDGQPAKDQSNGMSRRNGVQTPPPFGTRMRSNTLMGAANTWTSTEVYGPTPPPARGNAYGSSTTRGWLTGEEVSEIPAKDQRNFIHEPTSTTSGWLKNNGISKSSVSSSKRQSDNYDYSTTGDWLKIGDILETSINPTGIKGVWEQESTRRSDQSDTVNSIGHKGFVTKSDHSGRGNSRKYQTENVNVEWGQRQAFRSRQNSLTANRGWNKNNFENQELFDNSNVNNIPHRKSWK